MAKVHGTMQNNELEESERESKALSTKINKKITYLLNKIPLLGELFEFHGKIGEGTFSCVYLVSKKKDEAKRKFAVKHLIPTCHPSRIFRELSCMQEMGGVDNITEVLMCLRKEDCIVFVMPYLEHERFVNYVSDMTVSETRFYMKQLLLAVRRVHSFGIIHRDIKPSNFLYNRKERKFLLVDFGLAQKVEECAATPEDSENVSGTGKKRKREADGENQDPISEAHPVKRQALQQLSNNFTPIHEGKRSTDSLKRNPLQTFNRDGGPISFIRVQNSQVKSIGGSSVSERVFAKPQVPTKTCNCDGKPRVCNTCLTRKAQAAPRAGTPGFRPPEVLLKYPNQTTAVDIWAVGVVLLSITSATYPFFRSPDDVTALAEMITIFGSENMKNVAKKLGRNIVCSERHYGVDLRKVCERLRRKKLKLDVEEEPNDPFHEKCSHCRHVILPKEGCLCPSDLPFPKQSGKNSFPDSAYDLLSKLLDLDPTTRITAEQALSHPFIAEISVQ